MKFIFNFILYGIIFYALWLFFPDAFHTLVSWADKTFALIKDLTSQVMERWNLGGSSNGTPHEAPKALFTSLISLF